MIINPLRQLRAALLALLLLVRFGAAGSVAVGNAAAGQA
jgi:hypothetical protein